MIHQNTNRNTGNLNRDHNRNAVHELRRLNNLTTLTIDLLTAINGGGSTPTDISTETKQNTIISILNNLLTELTAVEGEIINSNSFLVDIDSNTLNNNTELVNLNASATSILSSLASLLAELELKADLTEVQPVETQSGVNTLSALNSTTTGTVTGAYSVSFFNDGAANVTVAGASIAPSLSISFEAEPNHTLDTINYDATGSSILITIVNA